MIPSATARFLNVTGLVVLPIMAAFLNPLTPAHVQAQESALPTGSNPAQPANETDPNQLRASNQNNSLLSLQGGQRLMTEASDAVSAQNYGLAAKKLQDARQVFNQLSNFYQELAASFSGIDNRVADSQRSKAVETAQMRDQATYQLALLHRAQNQLELSVPLLVQIVRSQNPTRELGKKAYQQLFEIGFVDMPYPRSATEPSSVRNLIQSSLLSQQGGQRLMAEANNAVSAQDYVLATKKLQDARQVFNQLSNFYQELAASFSGIDNRVADSQRSKALETAQLRDEATYQLALVHRTQNQPELAVLLLTQIVRSQNPTRELGKKAYQQLFELGFVDAPFPTSANTSPSSTAQ